MFHHRLYYELSNWVKLIAHECSTVLCIATSTYKLQAIACICMPVLPYWAHNIHHSCQLPPPRHQNIAACACFALALLADQSTCQSTAAGIPHNSPCRSTSAMFRRISCQKVSIYYKYCILTLWSVAFITTAGARCRSTSRFCWWSKSNV